MYTPVPVLNGGLRRHSGSPPAGEDDGLGCFRKNDGKGASVTHSKSRSGRVQGVVLSLTRRMRSELATVY